MSQSSWYVEAYGQLGEVMMQLPWTQNTTAEIETVIKQLGLTPNMRILDLGCGYGRHLAELSRRGFKATGVEISPVLADLARQQIERAGLTAKVLQQDARIHLSEQFDCVLCLAEGPIGYLDNDAENRQLLESIAAATRRGGILLMELVSGEAVIRSCPTKFWCDESGVIQISAWQYDATTGYTLRREKVITADGRTYSWDGRVRAYTYPEIQSLLQSVGFELCAAFTGIDMTRSFDGRSWDVVIHARRI